ncbi:MAG: Hsp20/alpha crystallin family protein [Bdellovibrionales bacterium]|nr:Hsp20/alpha crystallin family protein [Bdellovibrionales bacterium]
MANALERWLDNRRLSPFRDLAQFQEPLDRLFNEFMNMRRTDEMTEYDFAPSCDIAEEGNSYVMKFDMPGVSKEDVNVQIENDQLVIRAERHELKKHESNKKYLSEIFYGAYSRAFTLPGPVDEKKIDAKYENGVLTVTVPKTAAQRGKQIPIH